MMDTADRALGTLYGMAIGDALGMPTQSLSPQVIASTYGPLTGFCQGAPIQPYAPGMPAGSVTDDTEQALIVADLLITHQGHTPARAMADGLLEWEAQMITRGSHDLLGPSTKAALARVSAGEDPTTTGTSGTTNGAAMRVAPVGIAYSLAANPEALFDAVYESCLVTHNTRQGFAGAALVGAAVSAGIDLSTGAHQALAHGLEPESPLSSSADDDPCVDADPTTQVGGPCNGMFLEGDTPRAHARNGAAIVRQALDAAMEAVDHTTATTPRGAWAEGADVLTRTRWALALATGYTAMDPASREDFARTLREVIGTSVAMNEAVPAAFAIAWAFAEDPQGALLFCAGLGGDTDTIGAMVGAIHGAALGPEAYPHLWRTTITSVNDIDLHSRAQGLIKLRQTTTDLGPLTSADIPDADSPQTVDAGLPGAPSSVLPKEAAVASSPEEHDGGQVSIFGQAIVDLTMLVDQWPDRGADVFASEHQQMVGGAYNVMYAARQMDASVTYYGAIGTGPMGDAVTHALNTHGITHAGPFIGATDTGYCVAVTDAEGERTFLSTTGAETLITPQDWASVTHHPNDVVYIDGYSLYHPTTAAALHAMAEALTIQAVSAPRVVLCDVGPMVDSARIEDLNAIASMRPVWSMNARELDIFVQRLRTEDGWDLPGQGPTVLPALPTVPIVAENPTDTATPWDSDEATAAYFLHHVSLALGSPVVVRRGQDGALAAIDGGVVAVPALSVDVRDTNGAGDTFAGVLCALLAQGCSWEDALTWASAAASRSVETWGPATCPIREDVERDAQTILPRRRK